MSAGWVAGSVRAQSLLNRRVGTAGACALAAAATLPHALAMLGKTSYGHGVRLDQTITEAEHAIGATLLWHMRVLAGWQPRSEIVRLLAGGFEISNVDNLAWHADTPPYRLGALATAWSRLASATSTGELRRLLAESAWGDPGTNSAAGIGLRMRLVWADRVIGGVPDAARWAEGAAALLVAREVFGMGRRPSDRAAVLLGSAAAATSVPDYVRALPESARWALADVTEPADLWRAEAGWWRRVERDGFELVHQATFDSRAVVGVVAVLAADAWRVRAALQLATRGGKPLEAFDAIA